MMSSLRFITLFLSCLCTFQAFAAVTQTIGAGTAVTTANRTATFDSLTSAGIDLSDYSEDGLYVTVADTTHVGFDAFGEGSATALHYGTSGNNSFVIIKTTDALPILALEARLGDGWEGQTEVNIYWETWSGGFMSGSGSFTTAKGDTGGWSDPAGFDELRIGAYFNPGESFGDYQAIALDDVSVQLSGVVIRIFENGGNVEGRLSGSIDLAAAQGLLGLAADDGRNAYLPNVGFIGFTTGLVDVYTVDASWVPYGTSGSYELWDSGSGDAFVTFSNPAFGVPAGYVSGDPLSATVVKNGATLASLGMTEGTYTTTLTNGEVTDTVTIIVGSFVVVEEADLTISKLDTPDPVVAGTNLTYTIRVDNIGDAVADDVVVTDTLPAAMSLVSTSGCAEDPNGAPTCSLGSIAAGGFAEYTVTVAVDPSTLGSVVNNVTVATSSTESDETNNSATAETTVTAEADLSITKMDSSDPFVSGGLQMLTYTVEVSNAGPSDATNVVVTDTLSPLTTDPVTAGCQNDPFGVPDCQLGTIPAGGSASYTITVSVYRADGVITNSVSVTSDASDPDGGNDAVEEDTEVFAIPIPTLNNLGLMLLILLMTGIGWAAIRRF